MTDLAQDLIRAAAHLVERSGGTGFEIGHTSDNPARPGWYAEAFFAGARIWAQDHKTPTAAALQLAEKILHGSSCRCGETVTLNDTTTGCRWTLQGDRWTPGCNAAPVPMKGGQRGDLGAMREAFKARHGKEPNP